MSLNDIERELESLQEDVEEARKVPKPKDINAWRIDKLELEVHKNSLWRQISIVLMAVVIALIVFNFF